MESVPGGSPGHCNLLLGALEKGVPMIKPPPSGGNLVLIKTAANRLPLRQPGWS
jgi:hypothetical protein